LTYEHDSVRKSMCELSTLFFYLAKSLAATGGQG
jgi:hypothetical protein